MGNWRKSSYSDGNGGACLETASSAGLIHIRDTINRDGATLNLPAAAWNVFTLTFKQASTAGTWKPTDR